MHIFANQLNRKVKRSITILLLFCANFILLAHVILPHHHHDGVVVSLTFEQNQHKHHDHGHSHHDNAPFDQEDCFLSDLLSQIIFNNKNDIISVGVVNYCCTLLAILPDTYADNPLGGELVRHKPYFLRENIVPDIRYVCLRAPPVC